MDKHPVATSVEGPHGNKATRGCPCGFSGETVRACRCTPVQISRYRDRLSGPLRDRLDLTVEVPALPPDALGRVASGEPSAAVREPVVLARMRQTECDAGDRVRTNAELTARLMPKHAVPDRAGLRVLAKAVSRLGLSARGYDRVRKVARTIADLSDASRSAETTWPRRSSVPRW